MKKTILNIFDFDGTLVDTQTPENGKKIWEEKIGNKWPHIGWWGRKESLDNVIFEQPVIESTIEHYNKLSGDNNGLTIMLTGRRTKLSKEVEVILKSNNLCFEEYRYNYGGDTLSNKIKQITEILTDKPGIIEVNMFEDRYEHIIKFKEFFKGLIDNGDLTKVSIFHITDDKSIKEIKV